MAQQKKRHWLFRLSFGTLSLVLSGLLVLSYFSVVVDPAKAWFFTLFGLLYPLVLPLSLIVFVWSLIRQSSTRLLLAVALAPSLFFAGRFVQLSAPSDLPPAQLKVVSYNVGLFAHGPSGMSRLALADSVAAYLLEQDADLICLQEVWVPSSMSFETWLQTRFPGYRADYYGLNWGGAGRAGNATLSRLPVTGKGKHDFAHSTNLALWTDIRLSDAVVRVYNCHFESYNISLSGLVQREGTAEAERKMRRSISGRPRQVAEVLGGMDAAPVHSLVTGDFNDTPLSYTYFRLLRGRRDSFVRAGKGFGATYSTLWPLLRIDYLLYPPELDAVSYTVDRVRWSDHYPVIATYHETGRNPQ